MVLEITIMEITDERELLSEDVPLEEIIKNHPFGNYEDQIRQIKVVASSNGPRIDITDQGVVYLYLSNSVKKRSNYHYILFHEFGHICDRLDSLFGYNLKLRNELNREGNSDRKIFITDLWNVYIDGRLSKTDLFEFPKPPDKRIDPHCKKLINIDTIDSYIEEISCRFGSMGFDLNESKRLLNEVWNSGFGSLIYSFFDEQYFKLARQK